MLLFEGVLKNNKLEKGLIAKLLTLPSIHTVIEINHEVNVEIIYIVLDFMKTQIANHFETEFWSIYQENRLVSKKTEYSYDVSECSRRLIQNTALAYLMLKPNQSYLDACIDQFKNSNNMTETIAALECIVEGNFELEKKTVLNLFLEKHQSNPLVVNQWFAIQAKSNSKNSLQTVQELLTHSLFSINNPNNVRSVIGSFTTQNLKNFHDKNGRGYRFLADQVLLLDKINPQIASRILIPLTKWKNLIKKMKLMKIQLERILEEKSLSKNTYEIASKGLR